LENRPAQAVFLDIHMKSIQQDLAVRAADLFGKSDAFRGRIHDEMLETIDDFDAKNNSAILGRLDCFSHTFNRAIGEHPFILIRAQFSRPGTIIDAGHNGPSHGLHRLRHVFQERDTVSAHCSILGS
jgi:hypothetical protein